MVQFVSDWFVLALSMILIQVSIVIDEYNTTIYTMNSRPMFHFIYYLDIN